MDAFTQGAGRSGLRLRPGALFALLTAALLALMALSMLWGRYEIRIPALIDWLKSLSAGTRDDVVSHILLRIRLPRVITAAMVGTALSCAGSAPPSRSCWGCPPI